MPTSYLIEKCDKLARAVGWLEQHDGTIDIDDDVVTYVLSCATALIHEIDTWKKDSCAT